MKTPNTLALLKPGKRLTASNFLAEKNRLFQPKANATQNYFFAFLILASVLLPFYGNAQTQLQMSDFVLFSGANGPGTVQIGSSSNINGGSIGSLKLVKSTGTSRMTSNLYSQGTISLANSNTVTGKIAVSNSPFISGTILSVGSSANLGGNIDVNGNTVVSGGIVSGRVTHPTGTTYTGPTPALGNIIGTPSLPIFPALLPITTFPLYNSTPDITSTKTLTPGVYSSIKLSGNQTLTLKGAGVYVFNLIDNKNSNTIVFDFDNKAGNFLIYVHNNANLYKVNSNIINGGSASRIFTEVHGTGLGTAQYAFDIVNGSPSGTRSRWEGTVWAPYAAINIGSGTGSSDLTGALYSGTLVNIQSGVTINYAPFDFCTPPAVNAGADAVVCSNPTNPASVTLTASASGGTGSYNYAWFAGGVSVGTNSSSLTVTPSVTTSYTVTVTNANSNCSAQDEVLVSVNAASTVNAGGLDTACQSATPAAIILSGASVSGGATTGAWSIISGGGTLSNAAQTATPNSVSYTPAADFSGVVTLRLTTNALSTCLPVTADRTIRVNPASTVNANRGG